ncbi:PCI domain-containing protein 2 isoform X2 [Symphalangus syndactylus]|uniref:PCI domain-containing protein 2 isoform X2 n=1 Tax=Symphalangus syndactylus TaxID=9590 RepID=UPI0024420B52|nr:PCI domain-containing protein 2 isoform X5 [Symphalangus syndactylus]XP_055101108.1 PCI domain-containing protein 2 isoform X5 [Symphalangus syndactylus]XP_055101109.1 PCI domain-containing protein 2 isoform X5 [Symphalangus syndactylus]
MAHITINQYLQQVYEAIDTRDGASCAELVSFKHPHVANPRLQMASPEEKCQQVLEPPYDEMFAAHLRCTYAVGNHDFIEAYKCQTVIVQYPLLFMAAVWHRTHAVDYLGLETQKHWASCSFLQLERNDSILEQKLVSAISLGTSFLRAFQAHKEENWALPVMYAVALDLRVFANNADQQLVKKGKSKVGDMLEKAAELLMSCFRVCASDTRAGIEDSKKWGMLFLVNQLFKIYFKINKLHLCKPLIRAIDSSNLKDDYSTAQRVTYKYYVGRKAMFDSDFKQAEEYLSFAFEHCHRSSQKNKRMILIYLLPVKMLLGHMPTVELLKKYHLMQFAEVTRAVSEGNLLLLHEALAKHEAFFIRCGIFLILEKLKIITYRNLFKKVYLLLKTHQLSLDAFLVALKFMQVEDVDIDEVQCILANLIYMGHIKGYISHQHQKLVVSKQNPFPPLSTVC